MLEITRVTSRSAAAVARRRVRVGRRGLRPGRATPSATSGLRYAEATRALAPLLAAVDRAHGPDPSARARAPDRRDPGAARRPGACRRRRRSACCFADLVGFTRLGEQLQPEEIGALGERLGRAGGELARAAGAARQDDRRRGDAGLARARPAAPAWPSTWWTPPEPKADEFPELRAGAALGPGLPRGGRLVRPAGEPREPGHGRGPAQQRAGRPRSCSDAAERRLRLVVRRQAQAQGREGRGRRCSGPAGRAPGRRS